MFKRRVSLGPKVVLIRYWVRVHSSRWALSFMLYDMDCLSMYSYWVYNEKGSNRVLHGLGPLSLPILYISSYGNQWVFSILCKRHKGEQNRRSSNPLGNHFAIYKCWSIFKHAIKKIISMFTRIPISIKIKIQFIMFFQHYFVSMSIRSHVFYP